MEPNQAHIRAEQVEHYRLCAEAERRGIIVALDDPRAPQTVAELRALLAR